MANNFNVSMFGNRGVTVLGRAHRILGRSLSAILLLASVSGPLVADTLEDIEDNDITSNQTSIIHLGNLEMSVLGGQVSMGDLKDIYSVGDFGAPNGELDLHWLPFSGNPQMDVWKDVNDNGSLDWQDQYLFTMTDSVPRRTLRSARDNRFLMMARQFGQLPGRYHIFVTAPNDLQLNVYKAKSFGKFDNGSAGDFYVTTKLQEGRSKKSQVIGNDDTPVFNHSHRVDARSNPVNFEIEILDKDDASLGRNRDDRADINPDSKSRKLVLTYDYLTNEVRTKDGKFLGKSGGTAKTIKLKGNEKGKQVEVEFAIF